MMDRDDFLRYMGLGLLAPFNTLAGTTIHPLTKPRPLTKGDTVGLISPASTLPKDELYDKIIKQVTKLGYRVKVGANARNRYGYLAGSDERRAEDLNDMFADKKVDAIMPFRGGWGCNRILPLIDYQLIRDNPKILVGFSDITSLLLAIYARTGMVTFHGPVGKSKWTGFTLNHFRRALSGGQVSLLNSAANSDCGDCRQPVVITSGKAAGRLLGGNLSVLASMIGSGYLPEWEGSVLFLEDVGEDVYRIDRMLTQLKLSGILDKISGFIFGQCTKCDLSKPYSLTLEQVFSDHIEPLDIPAFSGARFGHIDDMITLPIGVDIEMNADTGTIALNETAVAG